MKIQSLLAGFIEQSQLDALDFKLLDFEPKGLSLNTQKMHPGDLFFGIKGRQHDARCYLEQAIEKGACALVIERENSEEFISKLTSYAQTRNIIIPPIMTMSDLESKLSKIAARYYGHPSQRLTVIGITGTNGKTTCAHLLAQALTQLGKPCGVIGTLTQELTTPDAISVQAKLAAFKEQGMQAVVMEVSSHGLDQYRVEGVDFESAIFSNLTQDHLDYHGSMEAYAAAKKKLFKFQTLKRVILNAQDRLTWEIIPELNPGVVPALYTTEASIWDNSLDNINNYYCICTEKKVLGGEGIDAQITTPWGQTQIHSKLLGIFNLSNLLSVLTELCMQGFELLETVELLQKLSPPLGRMQNFKHTNSPRVLVDYAHTPDALYNALKVARDYCTNGVLWCVFGCGGDRDKLKRPQMGYIAATTADKILITNDNPRHESEKEIIMDILSGIPSEYRDRILIEADREQAIRYAIEHAALTDLVLIAGKGHEDYQQIGAHRNFFSDSLCVENCLAKNENEIKE